MDHLPFVCENCKVFITLRPPGVNKVGVITEQNYQSLMDHLGSGKSWNLSRKREGLYLLPPVSGEVPWR